MIRQDFLERIRPHLRSVAPIRAALGGRQCQWQLYYSGHLTARIDSWAGFGADHNLVYGYPLLDRRVLEFIYAIPVGLHAWDGQGRYLCRTAMERVLPPGMTSEALKNDANLHQHNRFLREARVDRQAGELIRCAADWENPWVDIARLRDGLRNGSKARRIPRGRIPLVHALSVVHLLRHWRNSSTTVSDGN